MTNERYDPNGNIRNDYQGAQDFNQARELNTYKNRVQQDYTNRVRQQRQNLENKLLRNNPSARGARDARNVQKGLGNAAKKVGDAFNPKPAINDAQRAKQAIGDGVNKIRTGLGNTKAGKAINDFGNAAAKKAGQIGDAAQEFSKFKGSGSDYLDGFGNAFKGSGNPSGGGGNPGGGLGGVADEVAGGVVGGAVASGVGRVTLGGAARFAGNVGLAIVVNTVAVALANEFQKWIFGDDNDGRGGDTQRVDKRADPPFRGGQVAKRYGVSAEVEVINYNPDGTRAGRSTGQALVYTDGPIASISVKSDGPFTYYYLAVKNNDGSVAKGYLDWGDITAYGFRQVNTILGQNIFRVDGTTQAGDIAEGGSRIGEVDGIQTIFKPSTEPKGRPDEIAGTGIKVGSSPSEITKPKPRPVPPPLVAPDPKPKEPKDEPNPRPAPFPPPITTPDPKPDTKPDTKPAPDPYGTDPFPTNPVPYTPIGGNGGPSFNKGGNGLGGGSLLLKTGGSIPIPLDKTPTVDPLNPIDLTKDIPEPDIPEPITEVVKKPPTTTTQTQHDPCVSNNNPCATDLKNAINQVGDNLTDLLTNSVSGNFNLKNCDDETKIYPYSGSGFQGISSKIDALHNSLKDNAYKPICELDINVNIPDWWTIRIVDNPPTLCLQFAPKLPNGKLGSANTIINIPYFKGEKGLVQSLKGLSYTKGNINGIWHLKAGKVILYAKTESDCEKIFNKVKLLILPDYVTELKDFPKRKGQKPIIEKQVFLKFATYYPKGVLSVNEKAWEVKFKPE